MRGCGICSFSDIPSVSACGRDKGTQMLSISHCQKVGFNVRIMLPSGAQLPHTSLNWVYSIPVTLCFIYGHENNHCAAFSDPLEVMQDAKITMANSLWRTFSSLGKKVHKQTTPICCIGIHGPTLQINGGQHYPDSRINSLDTTKGK